MFTKYYCVFLCLCVYSSQISVENVTIPVSDVAKSWLASKEDVPYHAALKVLMSRKTKECMTYCAGVIIAPSKLLSAAHCLAPKNIARHNDTSGLGSVPKAMLRHKYAVAANVNFRDKFHKDSEEYGQWRTLRSAYFPKDYNFPNHDIAVIFTSKPYIFNKFVAAIPVASQHVEYTGSCLVSSFTIMRSQAKRTSSLLCAHLEIISTPRCSKLHRKNMITFVCTTSKLNDVGKADSGGPLVCSHTGDANEKDRGILVGVVSGHRPQTGSFFTRVSRYTYLIDRHTLTSNTTVLSCNVLVIFVSLTFCVIYGTLCLF